ncbi:MAG TPA: serine hydroxymethyltransferase [Candidatus Paceibacterota bacterium]|nr:serine hydroxymethyltransferase [Candidatus Paceibacterota bacterium]
MEQYPHIKNEDQEIFETILEEEKRQDEGLELIPSENYVSRAVREAMASGLTNKYSEGYPGKRYYGGQEFTDKIETIAIERAKALFGADHANVQPLGGAAMNVAAYFAWLEPGDTILGMDLAHGGHLTHGSPVTYMAKLYNFVRYGMKDADTGEIDYDAMREVAKKERPKIVLAGFSGYSRSIDWKRVASIAREVDAVAMADVSHIAGLIAGGALENPFNHGFNVVTTTTHKTLRGPRGGLILTKGTVSSPLRAPEKTIENLPTLIDRSVFPGLQGGPHMHQIAAKAIAFKEASTESFKDYAYQTVKNAQVMARVFMDGGVRLIGGGTDNHLLLADVFGSLGISGGDAETLLDRAGITLNKNSIAGDARKPFDPSGIRFGTPAMTTRGFKESEAEEVAYLMLDVLNKRDDATVASVGIRIKELAAAHPIPESFI